MGSATNFISGTGRKVVTYSSPNLYVVKLKPYFDKAIQTLKKPATNVPKSLVLLIKMIRFSLKVGIAAGAVYFTAEQGFWKDSAKSVEVYKNFSSMVSPFVQDVSSRLNISAPDVPSPTEITDLLPMYWNKGVHGTFSFICDIPEHVTHYGSKGLQFVTANANLDTKVSLLSTENKSRD